jgi:hypothetical protein
VSSASGAARRQSAPRGGGTPFVSQLRSRGELVSLGDHGGARLNVRVEIPELWDTIAFDVPAEFSTADLKREALTRFGLGTVSPGDFVLKLRGIEVRSEDASVSAAGAREGSTFLLTYRRRRPVR